MAELAAVEPVMASVAIIQDQTVAAVLRVLEREHRIYHDRVTDRIIIASGVIDAAVFDALVKQELGR
jgi:hypothetical protein